MQLSERQIQLVQGAAECLVTNLNLFRDEAVKFIALPLKDELAKRNVTLEDLDASSRAERAAFLRVVVTRIQALLVKEGSWSIAQIDKTIECFVRAMHESWDSEQRKHRG